MSYGQEVNNQVQRFRIFGLAYDHKMMDRITASVDRYLERSGGVLVQLSNEAGSSPNN